jgi:adenylate cyclase
MPLRDIELAALARLLPPAALQQLRDPSPSPEAAAVLRGELEAFLAAIAPFVPTPVLGAVRLPEGDEALGTYLRGTIVLAHLDGLQQLPALQGAGRQGSELTAELLGDLFGVLAAEVMRHGGGVVKFIGDGLVALFDAAQLGETHAAWACAAALAMQERLAERAALQPGGATLSLSVAAHSGRFALIDVGDGEHRELLLTGQAMGQVMQVRAATRRGQTLISAATAQAAAVSVEREASDLFRLTDAPAPAFAPPIRATPLILDRTEPLALAARIAQLQPYLPVGMPARLMQVSGGDFRPVTLLFANFCNFGNLLALLELSTLLENDLAIIAQILNIYYKLVQNEVHRYGGAVHKVDMAPFGDRLMAAFGTPQAHEDDPLRAAECAQAIRASLDGANREVAAALRSWAVAHPEQRRLIQVLSLRFRLRAALSSGVVFAGVLGTPERHDYSLVGETVRGAAQLLTYAFTDSILLSESTQRAVRATLPTRQRPPLTTPGAQPVAVYELLTEAATVEQPKPSRPLIGRHNELETLLAVARAALLEGQGARVALLTGEPGLGKTRLAAELRSTSAFREALALHESCQSYEQAVPYAIISRMLRRLLRELRPSDGREPDSVQLLIELIPDWKRFHPLLEPLLGLAIPAGEESPALAPEHQRERLQELVLALVQAAAHRCPLLLILDDLQWIDESSRGLVERLAQELGTAPVLLLLISRSSAPADHSWEPYATGAVVRLTDLADGESEALVSATLRSEPPLLLRPILARARGNPLLLEEMLHYLLERGLLQRDQDGGWIYLGGRSQEVIPTEVERMVAARLDRADPLGREVAQLLAVMGQQMSLELIGRMTGEPTAAIAALDGLVQSGLLVRQIDESGAVYSYKHELLRDAIYASMLFAQRRTMHARLAAGIAEQYAGQLDPWMVTLARHFQRAEQPERAYQHFLAAAQQAQSRYANREALSLYEQALATAPRTAVGTETLLDVYEAMGDISTLTGSYDAARESYERALRALAGTQQPGELLRRARLQRKTGVAYEQQGKLDVALPWLGRAEATLKLLPAERDTDIERAELQSATGWVRFRRLELEAARQSLEQALALLAPYDAIEERTRVLNRLGGLAWQAGELERAESYVAQSLAASRQRGDLVGQANALANLSVLADSMGRFEIAASYGEEALALHERTGSRRGMAIAANNVGLARYDNDKAALAESWFARACQLSVEVRDSYMTMRSLLNHGRALIALGDWERAAQTLRRSQFLAAQHQLEADLSDCYVALAELALQQGDLAGAIEQHRQGAALIHEPQSEEFGRLQRVAAMIAAGQGDLSRARQLLEATETLFRSLQVAPEVKRTRAMRQQLG